MKKPLKHQLFRKFRIKNEKKLVSLEANSTTMKTLLSIILLSCCINIYSCKIENKTLIEQNENLTLPIKTGAEQTELYFPLIKGKKIGIMTNPTGTIGKTHIVDSIKNAGFNLIRIFGPEHGFRGQAEAGEKITSNIDTKTGIEVVSLYGANFKPKASDLKDIEVLIFDIQDVGVRFYTYISSLHYIMEAAAENNIHVIVLDRPNPNGFYVDGPILKPEFKSFIGMHPVPIIHGMTIGEYAKMINGEKWLKDGIQCQLSIIPIANYTHTTHYTLPIAPSPNLKSQESIYLYPSLCLFEGTIMSLGRGTNSPFEIYGHPKYPKTDFSFTPISIPGVAANPPHRNVLCHGRNLKNYSDSILNNPQLELKWLIDAYESLNKPANFFLNNMFDKLSGTGELRQQIIKGISEEEIRKSWEDDLVEYKKIRRKYLLYEDFE